MQNNHILKGASNPSLSNFKKDIINTDYTSFQPFRTISKGQSKEDCFKLNWQSKEILNLEQSSFEEPILSKKLDWPNNMATKLQSLATLNQQLPIISLTTGTCFKLHQKER